MAAARQKVFPISWEQFHRDARALAWRLAGSGPFGSIVCIARGGLVPAAIVARELEIRVIETVSVASYDESSRRGELTVLRGLSAPSQEGGGAGILVVDDLTDTGRTALAIRAMLPRAHFAAVYAKPAGRPSIDTFVTEVSQDTWIYFPWDMGLSYQEPIVPAAGAKP